MPSQAITSLDPSERRSRALGAQRHTVPYSRVDCSGNEKRYVGEVIDSGWLTTASRAMELERRVAELVGAKHAIAVNSCTAGLHLALEAIGVGAGDRVFVPSLTFTASAEVIRYMGADPVLLDVDPDTGALTPEIVAEALEAHPEVRCLIAVHYAGRALTMRTDDGDGIHDLCKARGVVVVEDAAHALPARQGEAYVGSLGEITCFSFYANKTMTTGEGGMVTTDDDGYAERIRLMRLHGIDRDVWKRFTSESASWEYDVLAPGFKYNMPDLCAAVGLAQFERLEPMRRERQRCAEHYFEALSGVPGLRLPSPDFDFSAHAWHLFPVCVTDEAPVGRNALIERLAERGVGTSVHYKPLHRLRYYAERYELEPSDYPVAEALWNTTLSLPIYNLLTEDDLAHVVRSVRECLEIRPGANGTTG